MNANERELGRHESGLFDRVVAILENARVRVSRTVNSEMVVAYWLIGREIVEEEQQGAERAEYGKKVIADLSRRLTERYGRGYSVTSLKYFRTFYVTYASRSPEIGRPLGDQSRLPGKGRPTGGESPQKHYPAGVEFAEGFHPDLGWSQYRALMRVENADARLFYEREAVRSHWNKRQLERQINSLLFERLLNSRDKDGVLALAKERESVNKPGDVIKDPYVLEFWTSRNRTGSSRATSKQR
jgi:hypothetical protein